MKISTRSRYGVRLMVDLALKSSENPLFLRDIAESEDISEKYLSQIIIPLRIAGLVISFRGAKGGYKLAKDPNEISVYDIVKVLEGNLEIIDCVNNPDSCSRTSYCVAKDLWGDLQNTIKEKLTAIKLQDLVDKCIARSEDQVMYNI